MADLGLIQAEINSLPVDVRATMLRIFTTLLTDLRFGHPKGAQPDPMKNFAGGFFHATTPVTPGTEFTLPHGFGRAPYLAQPILLLDAVGSSDGVFTVSRAADDKRIYLTSTVASKAVSFLVEG
jgi:hypothetical protein